MPAAQVKIQVLTDLVQALGVFSAHSLSVMESTANVCNRIEATMEQRKEMLLAKQAYWEEEMDALSDSSDDDEDGGDENWAAHVSYMRERVSESIERFHKAWGVFQENAANFRRQAMRQHQLDTEGTAKALAFLHKKYEIVAQYYSLGIGGAAQMVTTKPQSGGCSGGGAGGDSAAKPLPAGFSWVSLSDIDMSEIPGDLSFQKISYKDGVACFRRLQNSILPALADDSSRGVEYFKQLDRENGSDYPGPLTRTYELFFGGDPIVLGRVPGHGLDPISGRHRIKLAQDLGWSAIPGKLH